jgi:hypothetical protein
MFFLLLAVSHASAGLPPQDKLFFKNGGGGAADAVETVRAAVGENVVLECEVGGSPSPTVHWLRNGQRIQQGNGESWVDDEPAYEKLNGVADAAFDGPSAADKLMSLQLSLTHARLFVDCIKPSSAGDYVCVAETPTKRISKQFNIQVDDDLKIPADVRSTGCLKRNDGGARVYMWTSHRIGLEESDVQLYCRVDGDPQPEVTWYDPNGVAIPLDNPQYKVLDNGDLLIHHVTWAKNMGLYRCVTQNSAGSDQVHVFLYPTRAN